jgi:hypothetical protein
MPKAAWMLAIAKEAPTRCLVVGGSIAFRDEKRVPAYSNAVLKYVVMAFWRVSEMNRGVWRDFMSYQQAVIKLNSRWVLKEVSPPDIGAVHSLRVSL